MLQSDPPPGVCAWPLDDHRLTHLQAQIQGPQGTVYYNGIFRLDIQVSERYPFEPPNIRFVTPVYHPNIDNGGRICLDILNLPPKGAWRPSLNLSTLLASIGLLLAEPNPDDGLMGEITAEYKHNRPSFDLKARKWTELYATQNQGAQKLNVSELKSFSNSDSEQNSALVGAHGQEPMEAASGSGENTVARCGTSSQPTKPGLSLCKTLTLDRGTQSLQQNNKSDSVLSQDEVYQVQTESLKLQNFPLENVPGCTKSQREFCEKYSSEEMVTKEGQSKDESIDTCRTIRFSKTKLPLQVGNKQEKICKDAPKGFCNEATIGHVSDFATSDEGKKGASLVKGASTQAADMGEGLQQDGCCPSSVSASVKLLTKSNDYLDTENLTPSIKAQECRKVTGIEKENQAPKHSSTFNLLSPGKSNAANSSHLAVDSGMGELNLMEVSSEIGIFMPACSDSVHDRVKEKRHLCLPSRTKSLKLSRAKLDSQLFYATKMQQTKRASPIEKSWTRPIIIPDDVPTVIVSDSGSDDELSDEGFTLSLTQRRSFNKKKSVN